MNQQITVIIPRANLTKDPEFRTLKNKQNMAKFSVAFNHRYYDKDKEEWVDRKTTFLNCVAYRDAADRIENMGMSKGDPVMIIGSLESSDWEDDDGNVHKNFDVEVHQVTVHFRDESGSKKRSSTKKRKSSDDDDDDDEDDRRNKRRAAAKKPTRRRADDDEDDDDDDDEEDDAPPKRRSALPRKPLKRNRKP